MIYNTKNLPNWKNLTGSIINAFRGGRWYNAMFEVNEYLGNGEMNFGLGGHQGSRFLI